jgi:hypothetical protein
VGHQHTTVGAADPPWGGASLLLLRRPLGSRGEGALSHSILATHASRALLTACATLAATASRAPLAASTSTAALSLTSVLSLRE